MLSILGTPCLLFKGDDKVSELAERGDVRFSVKYGVDKKKRDSVKKGQMSIFFTVLSRKLIWLYLNY